MNLIHNLKKGRRKDVPQRGPISNAALNKIIPIITYKGPFSEVRGFLPLYSCTSGWTVSTLQLKAQSQPGLSEGSEFNTFSNVSPWAVLLSPPVSQAGAWTASPDSLMILSD